MFVNVNLNTLNNVNDRTSVGPSLLDIILHTYLQQRDFIIIFVRTYIHTYIHTMGILQISVFLKIAISLLPFNFEN